MRQKNDSVLQRIYNSFEKGISESCVDKDFVFRDSLMTHEPLQINYEPRKGDGLQKSETVLKLQMLEETLKQANTEIRMLQADPH